MGGKFFHAAVRGALRVGGIGLNVVVSGQRQTRNGFAERAAAGAVGILSHTQAAKGGGGVGGGIHHTALRHRVTAVAADGAAQGGGAVGDARRRGGGQGGGHQARSLNIERVGIFVAVVVGDGNHRGAQPAAGRVKLDRKGGSSSQRRERCGRLRRHVKLTGVRAGNLHQGCASQVQGFVAGVVDSEGVRSAARSHAHRAKIGVIGQTGDKAAAGDAHAAALHVHFRASVHNRDRPGAFKTGGGIGRPARQPHRSHGLRGGKKQVVQVRVVGIHVQVPIIARSILIVKNVVIERFVLPILELVQFPLEQIHAVGGRRGGDIRHDQILGRIGVARNGKGIAALVAVIAGDGEGGGLGAFAGGVKRHREGGAAGGGDRGQSGVGFAEFARVAAPQGHTREGQSRAAAVLNGVGARPRAAGNIHRAEFGVIRKGGGNVVDRD